MSGLERRPSSTTLAPPPEAWIPARNAYMRLMSPVARFVHIEAASGVILLIAAVIALVWANSPFHESYHHLWHTKIKLGIGDYSFNQSLHFWINDGLMTVFFLVVGVEIKRELVEGELSTFRRAALPAVAAVGGMVVPALIYVAFNYGTPAAGGWGVPMATDIAFAVGVLTLLGNRVSSALRVLLLAIAIFYSSGFAWTGAAIAGGGIALLFIFQAVGIRNPAIYALPLAIIWSGMLMCGIHPTIAGVICGLATPVKRWYSLERFAKVAERSIDEFHTQANAEGHDPATMLRPIRTIVEAGNAAVPPTSRVQYIFHTWVAYGIMPVFALANAGVNLDGIDMSATGASGLVIGIAAGLALGKPVGIVGFSWVAAKLGLVSLPRGVDFRGLVLVGAVGGIGFTMAIFIAELAFPDPSHLGLAKLAVLIGTFAAALAGAVIGKTMMPAAQPDDVANVTLEQAESAADV